MNNKLILHIEKLVSHYGIDTIKKCIEIAEDNLSKKTERYDDYWRDEISLDDYDYYDPFKPFLIKDTKSGNIYKGHIVNAATNIAGWYDDYDNILEEVGELVLYVPELDKYFYFFCDTEGYNYYTSDPRTIYDSTVEASDTYVKHLIDSIKDEYGDNTIVSNRFRYIGQK